MATQRTPTLGLVLEDNLTSTARANLLRLDAAFAAVNYLSNNGVQLRARQDVTLQPGDPAIGGASDGVVWLGTPSTPAARVDVQASEFRLGTSGLRMKDANSGFYLGVAYAVVGGATSDRNLSISTGNANRSLTLGASLTLSAPASSEVVLSLTQSGLTTLTAPTSGTLVLTDNAQTLTSKTIDADLNPLSNIRNASVASAAAIDATKLANGQVSNTEFQYLDGVTSPLQAQLDGKQPTGAYLTALTGDVQAAGPGSAMATIQPLAITTQKLAAGAVTYDKTSLTNSLLNSDISPTAAIAYSKLNLAGSLLDADVSVSAAIAGFKVSPNFLAQLVRSSTAFQLDLDPSTYVRIQASPSTTASYTLTLPTTDGNANEVLTTNGAGALSWTPITAGGTVTSVALSAPSIFTVSGSPVTVSGTLDFSLNVQTANQVWAGPTSGSPATPTFRTLVLTDLPEIPLSKLSVLTASRALVTSAGGEITTSVAFASEVAFLSGVTSAIQTQLDGKQPTGNYVTGLNGDVTAAGPGLVSATIANSAVTNAKLANQAEATIKGRAQGAGTGAPQDLTATQATAILNPFTDSLKGLVPASGGGTTNFLRADGTFAAPPANPSHKATWQTSDGLTKTVTHNLSTADVLVQLYDIATGSTIYVDSVTRLDVNSLQLTASEAPPAGSWRVLILSVP